MEFNKDILSEARSTEEEYNERASKERSGDQENQIFRFFGKIEKALRHGSYNQ